MPDKTPDEIWNETVDALAELERIGMGDTDKIAAFTTATWDKPVPSVADIMKTMERIYAERGQHQPMTPARGLPIRVAPCDFITANPEWKQVRFPRSRKKRIRIKWRKNPRNFGFVDTQNIYVINFPENPLHRLPFRTHTDLIGFPNPTIIASPAVIAKLEAEARRLNRETDFAFMRILSNGE